MLARRRDDGYDVAQPPRDLKQSHDLELVNANFIFQHRLDQQRHILNVIGRHLARRVWGLACDQLRTDVLEHCVLLQNISKGRTHFDHRQ